MCDILLAMNFLVNKLEQAARIELPFTLTPQTKAKLIGAVGLMLLELMVLWQLMQPAELIFNQPTDAPRPESERVGVLKRF